MRGEPWTDDRVATLRRLWAAGETAAAIAVRLGGISRSAVMGKVFRLRLPPATAFGARPADDRSEQFPTPARRRRIKRARQPHNAAPILARHKSLLELTNETCRWPHGRPGTERFFFCGAAGANLERGRPYCPRHMRRAYPAAVDSDTRGASGASARTRARDGTL